MAARRVALSARGLSADGPVTYIQGCPPFGEGFAGATLHAVVCARAGDEVWPIVDGGAACGRGWRHCGVTYLTLQNIANLTSGPAGVSSRATQARGMFERADRILRQHGARYRDVVRTWIYLDEILGWYDEFNQVRNAAYREFGLLPGRDEPPLLPASTGIGGQTPSGAAATMDLLAVVSDQDTRPMMARLPSPLQHDAFRYGSAFSRGAVIRAPDATLVQVSGTAAIDEVGRSCHQGDIRAQIDRTLDTIAALLDGEGATLQDVCAATAFVKRREHAPVFWEMVARRGLQDLPVVCVLGDVCRDELLFEMDAEAAPGSRKVQ